MTERYTQHVIRDTELLEHLGLDGVPVKLWVENHFLHIVIDSEGDLKEWGRYKKEQFIPAPEHTRCPALNPYYTDAFNPYYTDEGSGFQCVYTNEHEGEHYCNNVGFWR